MLRQRIGFKEILSIL